jgi:hypothetical protein
LPIYVRQKNIGRRRNFAGAFNFTNAIATMWVEKSKASQG